MKKLDNNVLRKLILETIEESSILSEGKKKKKRLKEAEPVQQPSDSKEFPEEYGKEIAAQGQRLDTAEYPEQATALFDFQKFQKRIEQLQTILKDPDAEELDRQVAQDTFDTIIKDLKQRVLGEETKNSNA